MAYFYQFELILAGIILLSAMTFGGIHLWRKRKKEQLEQSKLQAPEETESNY